MTYCPAQGGLFGRISCLNVGASIKQGFHYSRGAVTYCPAQGGQSSPASLCFNVGASIKQGFHHTRGPALHCHMQGGLSILISCLNVGAILQAADNIVSCCSLEELSGIPSFARELVPGVLHERQPPGKHSKGCCADAELHCCSAGSHGCGICAAGILSGLVSKLVEIEGA